MATKTLDEFGLLKLRTSSRPAGKSQIKRKTAESVDITANTEVRRFHCTHVGEGVKNCEPANGGNTDLSELRAFDLNYSYGPAMGIARLKRWERANKLGLKPDLKIKTLMEQHANDRKYTQCIWSDFRP